MIKDLHLCNENRRWSYVILISRSRSLLNIIIGYISSSYFKQKSVLFACQTYWDCILFIN